jgi:hypothetical protein
LQQLDDLRLLGAGACGRFIRSCHILSRRFVVGRRLGRSVLEHFPDAVYGGLSTGLGRSDRPKGGRSVKRLTAATHKAVPDAKQACRRPRFGQLAKLIETIEVIASFGLWLPVVHAVGVTLKHVRPPAWIGQDFGQEEKRLATPAARETRA